MKNLVSVLLLCMFFSINILFANNGEDLKDNFVIGNPQIEAISAMAFGPDGILFIGDTQSAMVVAVDTKDTKSDKAKENFSIEKVDEMLAAMLGTTADKIVIQDMAVNPISQRIYLAVHGQDGTPVLFRTTGDTFEHVPLKEVAHSKSSLVKAPAKDAKDDRGRSLRVWTISDLSYHKGKVLVSGLSTEEFSSTFRAIPFPFKDDQMYASLEMYHASHGQYETHSPIKTFMTYALNGQDYLIASYTCTPLVVFSMDELKMGKHTKGKTVAELGNRNTPLDIISFERDGKSYLLLANTTRALMRIDPKDIENYKDYLTEPVGDVPGTDGITFAALPYVNVQQLDTFDGSRVVMLQRMANGDLNLYEANSRRL